MGHFIYLLTHIAETIIPMFEWMGPWSYVLLFTLIFMETGLVIFPWLPGESLIFLTCSFIAYHPVLKMEIVIPVFFFAALIGDTVNYFIGRSLSHWQWLQKQMIGPRFDKAQRFLKRHGIKAVAFGRFVPFIRTFVPLIAGTMRFPFHRFTIGNIIGVILWVAIGAGCGFYFGTIPFVRQHFSLIILAFVACSLIIVILFTAIKMLRQRIIKRKRML
ncbi:DedA family protein [Limosilactobacillus sp. STM2_1]|uniref:DedA family protein n=1 Tax=Limosilactobacillus rudii TaxID=2759755 RepID=A0A7W3YNG0_9LACO|nr:DedA family protein [Limosilactobacillus rudii]MBB1079544.1 DedA family protein [Limosilactobacillus rudii]MBB1097590.1 DedA family protein [Limosilactobacillus rudii]MCD7134699.1 DedA family protein [Limosilactobacillus rudii]